MNVAFVGKRDGREVFERVCVTCGLPFCTFAADREECAPCMKGASAAKKTKTAKPVVSLAEQMRIIEAYNREHGDVPELRQIYGDDRGVRVDD